MSFWAFLCSLLLPQQLFSPVSFHLSITFCLNPPFSSLNILFFQILSFFIPILSHILANKNTSLLSVQSSSTPILLTPSGITDRGRSLILHSCLYVYGFCTLVVISSASPLLSFLSSVSWNGWNVVIPLAYLLATRLGHAVMLNIPCSLQFRGQGL